MWECFGYDINHTSSRQCLIFNCIFHFAEIVLLSSGLLNFLITSKLSKALFQPASSLRCFTDARRGDAVTLHLAQHTPLNLLSFPNEWVEHENIRDCSVCDHGSPQLWLLGLALCWGGFSARASIMALDDSSLCSRTKSKLNPHQSRYKSTRRRSLPPDILLENDFKGKLQKNIRNIDPIHPRRTKKRPSIFSGRKCYFSGMLVQYLLTFLVIQWLSSGLQSELSLF